MQVKQVLFIQGGGGENSYGIDQVLVTSLKNNLGKGYKVDYPEILSDEMLPNYGWTKQIGEHIRAMNDSFILAGHSFGASMILKYLSEHTVSLTIDGVFLLATPFWSGNEAWQKSLKVKGDFATTLPVAVPFFFYHCQDDEEIPVSHLHQYKQKIPNAHFYEMNRGGHQFTRGLMKVAKDIKSL